MAPTNHTETVAQLTDYTPYHSDARWNSTVDDHEPDDRLDAAEGATWDDALALEQKASQLGITVETNLLAYLADDDSEFPAGKEHMANAQARFVAGDDPNTEYREAEGWNGIKGKDPENSLDASLLSFYRANLIAGVAPFKDPRNVTNPQNVTPEDLDALTNTDDEDDDTETVETLDDLVEGRLYRYADSDADDDSRTFRVLRRYDSGEDPFIGFDYLDGVSADLSVEKVHSLLNERRVVVAGPDPSVDTDDEDADDDPELLTDGGADTSDKAPSAYPLTVGTTLDRDTARLSPVDVQPGQVYETSGGERVEVVRDDLRGGKPLLVRYPDREASADTAHMSRYSFADMATFDGFTLVCEDADLVENEDDEDAPEDMAGEFVETARCPVCSRFMSTGFDGAGLPAAKCSRLDCPGFMDVRDLIEAGVFVEGDE